MHGAYLLTHLEDLILVFLFIKSDRKSKKRSFYGEDLKRKNLTKGYEVLPPRSILLSIFIPLKYANCNNGEFIQAGIRPFDLHAWRNRGVISMQFLQ